MQHARLTHDLAADEYRELAVLNHQTRLITPSMRDRLREGTAPVIPRLRSEERLRDWTEDCGHWERDKAAAIGTFRQGLRAEGRERRREAFDEERRGRTGKRWRDRNLASVDRASGEAISRGLKAVAGGPRSGERRGEDYEPCVPRQRYCNSCRPEVERAAGGSCMRGRTVRGSAQSAGLCERANTNAIGSANADDRP